MKFAVNDEVRSCFTGLVGVVVGTDYTYRVKNGKDRQEVKQYLIQWRDKGLRTIWMHEYQLNEVSEELKSKNEYIAEQSVLEVLIDSALDHGNKKDFLEYVEQKEKLLEEMWIRGFVKNKEGEQ